jgi:hypothetical protein
MPRNLATLLWEARTLLDVGSQGDMGELLGSSRRSGQRWAREEATPAKEQLHRLAALVFPKNSHLAAEIAELGGSTLQQLGIVRPPQPPPPPPSPAPPDAIHIVDTVVCAAAEAMQLMPDAIRPALRAAFRRARLARLTVEEVDTALSGASASENAGSAETKAASTRKKAQ